MPFLNPFVSKPQVMVPNPLPTPSLSGRWRRFAHSGKQVHPHLQKSESLWVKELLYIFQ